MNTIYLQPGDSHPEFPHWKVEQVYHSPGIKTLIKFQWVRKDGVRATLMGWIGRFAERRPWLCNNSSNIGNNFDIKIADKDQPMGDTDEVIMTHRWYSWQASSGWPSLDEARPMEWV